MTLWLYVTKDEYEFPIFVEDTAEKLARKVGVAANTVYSAIRHSKEKGYKSAYKKVVVD